MESIFREFTLDGNKYYISYDNNSKPKVIVYQDGVQKKIIVNKLDRMISQSKNIDIPNDVKNYVKGYCNGENKDDSNTTHSLGKILFDLLGNLN